MKESLRASARIEHGFAREVLMGGRRKSYIRLTKISCLPLAKTSLIGYRFSVMQGRLLRNAIMSLVAISPTLAQESLTDLHFRPQLDLSRAVDRAVVVDGMRATERGRKERAVAKARAMGRDVRRQYPDGRVMEIVDFDGPEPIYLCTHNLNAAISTGANLLWPAPEELHGSGITIGMWDGGSGRASHQEFGARLSVQDGSASIDHATHVGGTMIAQGVNASARGMARAARIDSFDWNGDLSEMTSRAATAAGQESTRIYLSNHSYGYIAGWNSTGGTGTPARSWEWNGNGTTSAAVENDFGLYNTFSRDIDALAFNSPFYLVFQSAGNDRSDAPSAGQTVALSPGSTTVVSYDPALHPAADGAYRGGYDSMGFRAVAKNVITIGAVNDAVQSGNRALGPATMTQFSSWGPTDDGRIKPDLVANGQSLFSSLNGSDTAYGNLSGTSMSTPNACGSAALLVEWYARLFPNQSMRAATLKGLLIHTADDLGNAGPDYQFGWGLINAKAAADLIQDHQSHPAKIRITENQLTTTITSRTHAFTWDGISPIRTTLSWTDPAGSATTTSDNRATRLINNLQLRLIAPDGTEHLPYVMPFVGSWTQASMSLPATRGINNTDNVEQVLVSNPLLAGTWRAIVSYSGTLTNNQQNYSLLVSGSSDVAPPPPPLALTSVSPSSGLSNTTVTADLFGTGLRADTVVRLTRAGQADLTARSVELIGEFLRCQFPLTNAAPGSWDVTAINPDQTTSSLPNAFTVVASIWSENFDATVTGWTSTATLGSNAWSLVSTQFHSPSSSYFVSGPATRSTTHLTSPAIPIPANGTNLQLEFWHWWNLRSSTDVGRLEFSIDNGAWFDVEDSGSGTQFSSNGYNTTTSTSGGGNANEFAGRRAWSGNSGSFVRTIVNFTDTNRFVGKSLRIRWLIATNNSGSSTGWWIDSISLTGGGDLTNNTPTITSAATTSSTETFFDANTEQTWIIERGTSANVSVNASDDGGSSNLTYQWSASGPAPVVFTPNGSNVARQSVADFSSAGDYQLQVTARDQLGLSTSSTVLVKVVATTQGLKMNPAVASMTFGQQLDFSAELLDQFDDPLPTQPESFVWTTNGGGIISTTGRFTATQAGGPYVISASSGTFTNFSSLTINPANASITLGSLTQTFDGQPKAVTAMTTPAGLAVAISYNGNSSAPVNAGTYQVLATIAEVNYQGSAQGTLVIEDPYQLWAQSALAGQSPENSAPSADADVDGLSNWVEYHLGLDPANPLSRLTNQIRWQNDEWQLLISHVVPTGSFTLQSSNDLQGHWQNEFDLTIVTTAHNHVITLPTSSARKFYRILYTAPPLP